MQRPRKRLNFENVPTLVPLLFLARTCFESIKEGKFDSRCLLHQTASTAVSITGEASENFCVAVRDRSSAKRLLQTEVQAGKQLNLLIYLDQCTYQVLMGF